MFRTPVALFAATVLRRVEQTTAGHPATEESTALKHHLKTRDVRLTVPSRDRLVSVSFVSTRALMSETIIRHDLLSRTAGYLPFLEMVGTQLSFTNLLAAPLSGEERVESRLITDEATIHSSALGLGEGFCYVRPAYNAELLERGEIQAPFPLKVDRVLYNQSQPFSSLVTASLEELLNVDPADSEAAESRTLTTPPLSLALQSLISLDDPTATTSATASTQQQPGWSVTVEDLVRYFSSNSTLHAYNYYRRSDGMPSAVWLQSSLPATLLARAGLINADGEPTKATQFASPKTEADVAAVEKQRTALKAELLACIPISFGVQLSPLAAGAEVEWRLWTLQRAIVAASATRAAAFSPLAPLLAAAHATHTTCQTVLSLVTGDIEGAFAVTKAQRQYTHDPAEMARLIEPVRKQLGIDKVIVELDAEAASRTPLDFFCRCSKTNILDSLVTVSDETLKTLMDESAFHCATCGKWHVVNAEDWSKLQTIRASAASKPPS